jgi:putative membrane protein
MMYGNWFGKGLCPAWGGYNGFSMWHGLMLLGFILLIIGVVLILRNKKVSSSESIELLKVEYIKGNITEEEYLNRKNVIERK